MGNFNNLNNINNFDNSNNADNFKGSDDLNCSDKINILDKNNIKKNNSICNSDVKIDFNKSKNGADNSSSEENNFYTFNNYIKRGNKVITPSMEDYIEMIYRLSLNNDAGIRVNDLSNALNVKPPSTTKMIKKLNELDICECKKFEAITLTDNGKNIGMFLIDRHETVYKFLEKIGVKNTIFEQTEKIEHVIDFETINCMKKFLEK